MGLDCTIVRLAAIFLCVFTQIWPGLITYAVAWYLIPDADAPGYEPKKDGTKED